MRFAMTSLSGTIRGAIKRAPVLEEIALAIETSSSISRTTSRHRIAFQASKPHHYAYLNSTTFNPQAHTINAFNFQKKKYKK
jgi:hypothetical protein